MKQNQVYILILQLFAWFDLYVGDTIYYVGLSVNTKDIYKKFASAYPTVNAQQRKLFYMPISSNRWQKRLIFIHRVPGL